MQHRTPIHVPHVSVLFLNTREHGAVRGKRHKDPRKETGGPQPFEDQADISPEFCRAVKDINTKLQKN